MAKKEKNPNKEKKRFFKDFKAEIKKVIWPTPKQLVNNTVAIITMVIVIGAIVFVLDLGFDAINKYGLTNLQKSVQSIESTDNNQESKENETTTEETTNNTENQ